MIVAAFAGIEYGRAIKTPRTLPKLIDGKKSFMSTFNTQRFPTCGSAFVKIDRPRMNP
jgi:hypothetical protein